MNLSDSEGRRNIETDNTSFIGHPPPVESGNGIFGSMGPPWRSPRPIAPRDVKWKMIRLPAIGPLHLMGWLGNSHLPLGSIGGPPIAPGDGNGSGDTDERIGGSGRGSGPFDL